MKNKTQIVMLQSNQKATEEEAIVLNNIGFDLWQHLYFLSEERPIVGDWVFVSCSEAEIKEIVKVKEYYNEYFVFDDFQIHMDYCRKIIASTNKYLGLLEVFVFDFFINRENQESNL